MRSTLDNRKTDRHAIGRDGDGGERQREIKRDTDRGERDRQREASFLGILGRAATYQFFPEPGYRFVDTFKAFQLASGLGPSGPAGTPIRWGLLPGLSPGG